MRAHDAQVQRARMRKALAAMAIVAVAFPCACALTPQKAARASGDGAAPYTEAIWEAVREGADAVTAIERAGLDRIAPAEAPAWFADEVMDVSLAQELWADRDRSVVGFALPMGAPEALGALTEQLEGRGWRPCASGAEGVAVYMKEEGEVRWMMVECTEEAGEATAVLRILRD